MNTHVKVESGSGPLISVIVRSIGRAGLLQEALSSVARQTYGNIEVVLVDATGTGHLPFDAARSPTPLRVTGRGRPLARGQAANLGMDDAAGQFFIFLDDDDWFDDSHVAGLVAALQAAPDARAAYAGVRCIDSRNPGRDTILNRPFDPVRLLAVNEIPIHALLFSRELVHAGCRFDEDLPIFEDWDFWIQISRHTHFVHVDRVTAVYRLTNHESSGLADPAVVERATDAIYAKWRPRWTAEQVRQLMLCVREHGSLGDLQRTVGEQGRQLAGVLDASRAQYTTILDMEKAIVRQTEHIRSQKEYLDGFAQTCDAQQGAIARLEHTVVDQSALIEGQRGRMKELVDAYGIQQGVIAQLEGAIRTQIACIQAQEKALRQARSDAATFPAAGPADEAHMGHIRAQKEYLNKFAQTCTAQQETILCLERTVRDQSDLIRVQKEYLDRFAQTCGAQQETIVGLEKTVGEQASFIRGQKDYLDGFAQTCTAQQEAIARLEKTVQDQTRLIHAQKVRLEELIQAYDTQQSVIARLENAVVTQLSLIHAQEKVLRETPPGRASTHRT